MLSKRSSPEKKKKWILDGYMIMQKFQHDSPEEASCVRITKHMINDVFEEDMIHFTNLTELVLKDNLQIPMYKLRNLPALSKLDLSFNRIEDLHIEPKLDENDDDNMLEGIASALPVFSSLLNLNLSFNKLSFDSLCRLTKLHNTLQNLDLSGNHLVDIPSEFRYFTKLECLNLSNNCFRNTKENILGVTNSEAAIDMHTCKIFDSLSKILPLKQLNLSQNMLKGIRFK